MEKLGKDEAAAAAVVPINCRREVFFMGIAYEANAAMGKNRALPKSGSQNPAENLVPSAEYYFPSSAKVDPRCRNSMFRKPERVR